MFNTYVISALVAATAFAAEGNYNYNTNGADWGDAVPLCKDGKEQSPIDLKAGATVNKDIELVGYNYFNFNGANSDALASNHGKKMNFPTPENANAELKLVLANGQQESFTPAQFHFHAPSEHTVDGKFYDLEVHFVHLGETGDNPTFSVVGVFFDIDEGGDEENPFIKSVLDALSTGDAANAADRKENTVKEFFNTVEFGEFWSYPGSFTTPPCTEGVRWNVVKDVQPINAAQLEEFTKYWAGDNAFAGGKGNNRVVQPINDRTLYISTVAAADNTADDSARALFAGAAATIAAIAALAF